MILIRFIRTFISEKRWCLNKKPEVVLFIWTLNEAALFFPHFLLFSQWTFSAPKHALCPGQQPIALLLIYTFHTKTIISFFSDFRPCVLLPPLTLLLLSPLPILTIRQTSKATWRHTNPTSFCLLGKCKGPYHPVWLSGWSITSFWIETSDGRER